MPLRLKDCKQSAMTSRTGSDSSIWRARRQRRPKDADSLARATAGCGRSGGSRRQTKRERTVKTSPHGKPRLRSHTPQPSRSVAATQPPGTDQKPARPRSTSGRPGTQATSGHTDLGSCASNRPPTPGISQRLPAPSPTRNMRAEVPIRSVSSPGTRRPRHERFRPESLPNRA